MKQKKQSSIGKTLKTLLFTYLAITKVMYWTETISLSANWSEFGEAFLHRMLNQDIVLITILIAMHFLEKYFVPDGEKDIKLTDHLTFIGLGWGIFISLIVAYHLILGLFVEVNVYSWPRLIVDVTIVFAICSVFLYIKAHLKEKEAETYLPTADTSAGQLALLNKLHDAGILTDEELEAKTALIQA